MRARQFNPCEARRKIRWVISRKPQSCCPFLPSMHLTRSSRFPFPFFTVLSCSSALFHARSVPSLSFFGATTLPFLRGTLVSSAPSLSSLGAIAIPADLSRISVQFPVFGTYQFPWCCYSSCFTFSLSVYPSRFSGVIPLVRRAVAVWRGDLFLYFLEVQWWNGSTTSMRLDIDVVFPLKYNIYALRHICRTSSSPEFFTFEYVLQLHIDVFSNLWINFSLKVLCSLY